MSVEQLLVAPTDITKYVSISIYIHKKIQNFLSKILLSGSTVQPENTYSNNQPNRKRWGAKLVNVKHLPHKAFLL